MKNLFRVTKIFILILAVAAGGVILVLNVFDVSYSQSDLSKPGSPATGLRKDSASMDTKSGDKTAASGTVSPAPATATPKPTPKPSENVGKYSGNGAQSGDKNNSSTSQKNDNTLVSYEELLSMKDISLKDKIVGLSIIRKIKKSDLDKIIAITQDGVTASELEEADGILRDNLSDTDVDKLKEILFRNRSKVAEESP